MSRGGHYDHGISMADQNAISVEQRAAAIMDRIKQVWYASQMSLQLLLPLVLVFLFYSDEKPQKRLDNFEELIIKQP